MARGINTPKGASFVNRSSAAVDVEYRIRAAHRSALDIMKYLGAIDRAVFPPEMLARAESMALDLNMQIAELEALRPKKRSEMTPEEKEALKKKNQKTEEPKTEAAPAAEEAPAPTEELKSEAMPEVEAPVETETPVEEPKAETPKKRSRKRPQHMVETLPEEPAKESEAAAG